MITLRIILDKGTPMIFIDNFQNKNEKAQFNEGENVVILE